MNYESGIHSPGTKVTSKNMQFLKNVNRAAVIRALALKKASNRTELASYTNLTRMAISNIVNELREKCYVEETSRHYNFDSDVSSFNGRRPKQLALVDWSINAICINIRRYSLSCMLMDINGNTRFQSACTLPEDVDNQSFREMLTNSIEDILQKASDIPIAGIGISSIGPLDIYKKRLLNPPDFRNISNVDIGELLENKFHLPVYMDNDMNCSSLAELFYGTGASHRDLVFLGFSSGVGAGVIMNEKILHGFGGFAGEVGHISVTPHGPLCPCGQRGCIELYTMGKNILKNVGLQSFDELNAILEQENPPLYITNCINEYLNVMQTLMVAVANSYDPDIVILGDIDIRFITRFIPQLEEYMNTRMLNQGYKRIPVVPSTLAEAAPLYGAGSIVFQRIFDGTLPLSGISSENS